MITMAQASAIIAQYKTCWVTKDPEGLRSIFAAEATYTERYYTTKFHGLAAIEQYWHDRVVAGQANIDVDVKHIHLSQDIIIAEWEACFDDLQDQSRRKMIYEVAIMEIGPDGKITALREFWDRKVLS